MISREEDGIWIGFEETISIHYERVFAAITTAAGLTGWLCLSAEVDLRKGGLIVLGWDEEMAKTSTVAILDYSAGGTIVWDWYTTRGDTHAPVYWTVEPSVEHGSKVLLRQGPFGADTESLLVLAEEAVAWRWYLNNLRTTLEVPVGSPLPAVPPR